MSLSGVCAYDGSLPACVSEKLKKLQSELEALQAGTGKKAPKRLRFLKDEIIKTKNRIGNYDRMLKREETGWQLQNPIEREMQTALSKTANGHVPHNPGKQTERAQTWTALDEDVKSIENWPKNDIINSISFRFFANKGLAKQNTKQLQKSIASWKEHIKLHRDKVANPSVYDSAWDTKTEAHKAGLIHHWEHEIYTAEENIKQAIEEIKKRGDTT